MGNQGRTEVRCGRVQRDGQRHRDQRYDLRHNVFVDWLVLSMFVLSLRFDPVGSCRVRSILCCGLVEVVDDVSCLL